MNIVELVFYFFGGTTLLSALLILLSKNVLYNAFFLLLSFLSIAALYVFAGADFIAVTQIMVYVGGILVLLIFGIMFTNRQRQQEGIFVENGNLFIGLALALTVFCLLAFGVSQSSFGNLPSIQAKSSVYELGTGLMTSYLIPFELAAVLLLAALIGAALIAWNGSQKSKV